MHAHRQTGEREHVEHSLSRLRHIPERCRRLLHRVDARAPQLRDGGHERLPGGGSTRRSSHQDDQAGAECGRGRRRGGESRRQAT